MTHAHTTNGIAGPLTTRAWLMLAVLGFFVPFAFSNYFFHDEVWMLSWSINAWSGNELACGHSNLFWGSYFMDGRFLSAFIADCVVKPTMNWGYARGDIYTAQALIIAARTLSLLFFAIFVWQMAKLLERTSASPVAAATTTLAVAILPGMAFMVLWGHAIIFNVSFLFTAAFIIAFRKSIGGENPGAPFDLKLLLITVLVSFGGYGLYIVTGLYLIIPVALYIGLVANDFQWNSTEEKAVRTVLLGVVAATLIFVVMQKIAGVAFSNHVSANEKPSVAHLGVSQLLTLFGNMGHRLLRFPDPIMNISYLWFLPQGYLSDAAAAAWTRASGILLHLCILGSLALMIRRTRQPSGSKITVNARFFYLIVFLGLTLSFVEMANAIQPRVTMVAQAVYLAMAIALGRHLFNLYRNTQVKALLSKVPLAAAFALWLFMHWYVLNSMLLISAREEGMLSTMLYALSKGEVSSVTVHQPNMMVEPDSYGPTLFMVGHAPVGFAAYYLSSQGGWKQGKIEYTTDAKSWFRFRNVAVGDKPGLELYFDGREMLPRPSKWTESKLNAADKAAVLTAGPPLLTVSSSAFANYDPKNLLTGDIWHSVERPAYPQWIGIRFTQPLTGATVALWHQPSHADRFPKSVVVHGYLNGTEVSHFTDSSLSCVPGQTPSRIDLSPMGKVDSVRLEIQSNCGDPQFLTIGRLEIQ